MPRHSELLAYTIVIILPANVTIILLLGQGRYTHLPCVAPCARMPLEWRAADLPALPCVASPSFGFGPSCYLDSLGPFVGFLMQCGTLTAVSILSQEERFSWGNAAISVLYRTLGV